MGRLVAQSVAGLHLAVQQAQGVAAQAVAAVVAETVVVAGVVVAQALDVSGAAFAVADAVDQQLHVAQAQVAHQLPGHLDDLGVHRRVGVA